MRNNKLYRSLLLVGFAIILTFILFVMAQDRVLVYDSIVFDYKQKGAHVFSIQDSTDFPPLIQNNIEWITMVSWGFQDDIDSPLVTHHSGDTIYMLRHDSSWVHRIKLAREAGFKVFFKPHLWLDTPSEGKWRSDIFPSNDEDWEIWQATYRDFILRYAKVAERAQADMFCIGTEFSRLSLEKPDFWRKLIQDIRKAYSGKIIYAANWYNEFENITFWDDLDFIGIQAYFPLVENVNPSVEQISNGWNKYIPAMEAIYKKYDRKIVFTEMGYRSTFSSAIKPWEWEENASSLDHSFSAETQANCYEAFFNTVWPKDWFAGVHIWQLRSDFIENKERDKLDFTPQGKPAEDVIARNFE